jgi:hypothetical protein
MRCLSGREIAATPWPPENSSILAGLAGGAGHPGGGCG